MFGKSKVSQSMIDAVNSVLEVKVEQKDTTQPSDSLRAPMAPAESNQAVNLSEASEKVSTPTGTKVYGSSYGNSKKARQDQTKSSVDTLKGPKAKEMKEAAKPDFLDMDKDGNKKESMKKAVADKNMKEELKGETFEFHLTEGSYADLHKKWGDTHNIEYHSHTLYPKHTVTKFDNEKAAESHAKKTGGTVRMSVSPKMKNEELKGNQHRIDANNNNKIDAQDFKILKAKKKVKEDMSFGNKLLEMVRKSDIPAYLRKAKGDTPLTVADAKAPRKDSISAPQNLAKARNEEVMNEMDKSQPSQERHGDYPLGSPTGTPAKPVDPKKLVKTMSKLLHKSFDPKKAGYGYTKEELEQIDETPGAQAMKASGVKQSPDKLLARTGMNIAHKFPRPGQTNLGNIPGMNTPGVSKDTADYAEKRRGDRAKQLKPAIKAALGTHGPKGKLPEEVELDEKEGYGGSDPLANRASYAKKHGTGQVYKKTYPGDKVGMTKAHAYDIKRTGPKGKLPEEVELTEEQLDEMINEVLGKDATAGDYISDFVHSDNPKFAGKSKAERKKMALGAYYGAQKESHDVMSNDPITTDTLAGRMPGGKANSFKSYKLRVRPVEKEGVQMNKAPEVIQPVKTPAMKSHEVHEATIAGLSGWKKMQKDVKDKSGAVHTPMSRAKDLARAAFKDIQSKTKVK